MLVELCLQVKIVSDINRHCQGLCLLDFYCPLPNSGGYTNAIDINNYLQISLTIFRITNFFQFTSGGCKQPFKQGDKYDPYEGNTSTTHELLHTLRFCTGVIVAIALEEVDYPPDA